ncbi:MAG: DUF885 family protein [Planctomycetota bacterium]|nr:DUF885 family protein [Planctomycetota bacterium]MDA1113593.1 DUF885 family protein [Planctomycetota bacterium]
MLLATLLLLASALPQQTAPATTAELIAQYTADRDALARVDLIPLSTAGLKKTARFTIEWTADLDQLDFESLSTRSQIDWLLLRNQIAHEFATTQQEYGRVQETLPLIPFAAPLVHLLEEKSKRHLVPAEEIAQVFADATLAIDLARDRFTKKVPVVSASVAHRAAGQVEWLQSKLRGLHEDRMGYEPDYSWWCSAPWETLRPKLDAYATFLREELGGQNSEDADPLIGDPIGREALVKELQFERIAYSPEELIAIAEREFAWCQEERKKAATEMGLGEDWRAAQEHVKSLHVPAGKQPQLIRELADEAVTFLEERDLVTIPAIAKRVWRMDMMSVERQKYTPYFTGGEVISIAYPTDGMEHEDKIMSMRGNNRHYAKATVHHELIPGHHLQGYMSSRWNPHRRAFYTPFLVEGWALYWELRLWDMDFAESPEDRIGMLFWRSHRCARIIFSLKFHLGEWTPEECIDFLVDQVGHERRNATAEVRRSIQGGYGPLYQCAYMTGGLQLRALQKELVENGTWTDKQFHDAVLRAGPIPLELLRAELLGLKLTRDFPVTWRFDNAK